MCVDVKPWLRPPPGRATASDGVVSTFTRFEGKHTQIRGKWYFNLLQSILNVLNNQINHVRREINNYLRENRVECLEV